MKTMSIIGIVWFSISFLFIISFIDSDANAAIGWGILAILYALPFSIAVLVQSNKKNISSIGFSNELNILHELKEKGALTEEEFQQQKEILMTYQR